MKILPVNWRFLLLTVLITSGLFGVGVTGWISTRIS